MTEKIIPPDFADVEAAYERIKSRVVRTPLLRCDMLDEKANRAVFIKAECLQKTGSFKYRGASNRLMQVDPQAYPGGVVAFSSGNHAQGVAAAAAEASLKAAIVMPEDAPLVKSEGVRYLGAEVVSYNRASDDRERIARDLAARRKALLIPSYDDPLIIAGQGSVGLEIAKQCGETGVQLEALACGAGGGGLMAGISLAMSELSSTTKIYTVEPDGFDDHKRSFLAGKRVSNAPDAQSICDAIMTPMPGAMPFAINKELVSAGFAVSDDEVRAAMRFAFKYLKIVIEPGGAVSLAAALQGKVPGNGPLCVVATGGNVDPVLFAGVLSS